MNNRCAICGVDLTNTWSGPRIDLPEEEQVYLDNGSLCPLCFGEYDPSERPTQE